MYGRDKIQTLPQFIRHRYDIICAVYGMCMDETKRNTANINSFVYRQNGIAEKTAKSLRSNTLAGTCQKTDHSQSSDLNQRAW